MERKKTQRIYWLYVFMSIIHLLRRILFLRMYNVYACLHGKLKPLKQLLKAVHSKLNLFTFLPPIISYFPNINLFLSTSRWQKLKWVDLKIKRF